MSKTSTLWLWVFWLWFGCLPSQDALGPADADARVDALRVSDSLGASWPESGIPRAPRFELTWEAEPEHSEERVWLVAGVVDDALREDLLDPPLRASSAERLVELAGATSPADRTFGPIGPLTPGQRYTLAVLEGASRLWSRELVVSASPAAGARFTETLPADQARGVPPNLMRALLRFDGYLRADGVAATLEANGRERSTKIRVDACSELGLPEGDCLSVTPDELLPAHAAVVIRLRGLEDSTGARLDDATLHFETSDTEDTRQPRLTRVACALDERALDTGGCVLEQDRAIALRLGVDEPVLATLTTAQHLGSALSLGGSIELALSALEVGSAVPSTLSLTDLAGHTRSIALALATHSDLAQLSIDEVRCDPLGPEPAQESVELLNFGRESIQIMGFSLSDDALDTGVAIVDDLSVLPGERVLVVGPDFDPRDTLDGLLSAGIRLARTSKALSLANEGAALFLRDARGLRVSAAPRLKSAHAGACIARIANDPRSGARDSFAHDPDGTCTPGLETMWP